MAAYPFGMVFRDSRGFLYTVRFYTLADDAPTAAAQATAFAAAFESLSNADFEKGTGCLLVPQVPASRGGLGTYASGTMKAVLVWQDEYGDVHRYRLPAPSSAIFLADGITINQAYGPMATALAAFVSQHIGGRSNVAVSDFLGGYLRAGKQRRRLTQDILAPSLANQG